MATILGDDLLVNAPGSHREPASAPPAPPNPPPVRWATSVLTSGVVLVLLVLEDRRGWRSSWAEWLSYWRSAPAPGSAKDQHRLAALAWLVAGLPLALLSGALASGADHLLGAEPLPMIATAFVLTALAQLTLHGVCWTLVPARRPTPADRLRSGWPPEAAAVALVVWVVVAGA